jgi:excisionase family DNA binding protein
MNKHDTPRTLDQRIDVIPHRHSGERPGELQTALSLQLLRAEAVAQILDVSRTKVFELIQTGQLRSLKVGGLRRIPVTAINGFIAGQAQGSHH